MKKVNTKKYTSKNKVNTHPLNPLGPSIIMKNVNSTRNKRLTELYVYQMFQQSENNINNIENLRQYQITDSKS